MISLHTRAICDACRVNRATTEIDSGFFLCDLCAGTLTQFVLNSVTPTGSASGVNAAASDSSPPSPTGAAASISIDPGPCGWAFADLESPLAPAMAGDAATGPALADPPVPVAADFEAEVSALEAAGFPDLPACLDRRNSMTFLAAAVSAIASADVSKSVSEGV